MTDKKMTNEKSIIPHLPPSGFVHRNFTNGLTVSTCLRCMKSISSPTPAGLRMAEENHPCEITRHPQKSR